MLWTVCPILSWLCLLINALYFRYRALYIESYVKVHSYLRFCPFPGCEQVVSCHGATGSTILTRVPTVTCASSHSFCFGCGMDVDHRPIICAIANLWAKSAKEDSGTSQWIQANTKNCPQCKNATEKNGGCKCVTLSRSALDLYVIVIVHWTI